jgi:ribosomal protein S18 acetylase RimI-like enzyme
MDVRRLRVRAARAPDLDRVLELWTAARSPHARTADTPEVLARLVGRDPEALLVAELDGRIVGTLIAAFDGWRGNMYRLAVEAGLRREGIGASLISEGEGRLRAAGARRISALVGSEDDHARAFWDAAGYEADPYIARYVKNV